MAVPQGFRPSLSPAQVRNYRHLYERQPERFDENTLKAVQHHAEYYNLPFAESNKSFGGRIGGIMKQAGAGLIEGFTTFNVSDDPPDDDAEAIARNIGHLAGFVGYIPTFGRTGGIAKAIQSLKGKSVPMYVAGKVQKKATKVYNESMGKAINARAAASSTATKFLQNDVVKDMAGGAFHLGVASAVSSWQHGVDEMMSSFVHGAGTGAVFRFIGNKVSTGTDNKVADRALRSLSASLFTGLPSSMRGDTTPMQIYQYLLGAYFGANESPFYQRRAGQFLNKMRALEQGPIEGRHFGDAKKVEGFAELDPQSRKIVEKEAPKMFATQDAMLRKLVKHLSKEGKALSEKEIEAEIAKIKSGEIEFTEEGEPIMVKKKAEKEPEKKVEEAPKTVLSGTSGISIMRNSKYGNPFVVGKIYDKYSDHYKKLGYIRVGNVKEAIERYDNWLRGTGDKGYLSKKRDEILKDIKSGILVGKTLKYHKPGASDSHAVRLIKLIEESAPKPKAEPKIEPEYTIEYTKSTKTREGSKDIVPAYIDRKANKIIIDKDLLKQKFDDQAWTKPKVEGVKPLEKDQFKTYEEWERFVIEHEKSHAINPKRKNESKADYENRMNEIALYNIKNIKTTFTGLAKPVVIHSGAAKGADTVFEIEGIKRGDKVIAHSFKGHGVTSKNRNILTDTQLQKADKFLKKANQTLERRFPTSNEKTNNLLRRNYYQVKDSDKVIAISRIENGQVKGGTAWATQMAIDMGKPVHVFDMISNKWFTWNNQPYGSGWVESSQGAPKLEGVVAGIGSRNLTSKGKAVIEGLFKQERRAEFIEPPKNPEIIETNNTLDDVDPQNIPDRMSATAYTFVSNPKYMRKELEKKAPEEVKKVMDDISVSWIEAIKQGKIENKNPGELMIDYIESNYPKFDMNKAGRKEFWLSTGVRRLKDSPVQMISVTTERGVAKNIYMLKLDEKGSAVNEAGNRKFLAQEKKRIDKVYETDFKESFPDKEVPEYSYAVLDHIVIKTKNKNFKEMSLPKYKQYLKNFYEQIYSEHGVETGDRVVEARYYREIGNIMKKMSKEDLYYYGGRGDAERMYFSKVHPKAMKSDIQILRDIGKLKLSDTEKVELKSDRNDFVERYGDSLGKKEARSLFNKSFISNIYYTLRTNGFKGKDAEVTNFRKVLDGDKYVITGKGYNKRAQIWLTNGYSADAKAVRDAIENYKGIGKSDLIEEDGVLKFKVVFVKDNGKPDAKLTTRSPASDWAEGTDGGPVGRKDFIEGLNRGQGLETEGNANKSFIVSPDPTLGAVLGKYMIHGGSSKVEGWLNKNGIHLIMYKSGAKQLGERLSGLGEFKVTKDGKVDIVNAKVYKIPVEDVKVILSEKTDKHMLDNKQMVKQMFTNQTPFGHFDPKVLPEELRTKEAYEKKVSEIMDDMYYNTIWKRIEGVKKYNTMVNNLAKNPKKYEKNIDEILENIDSVGLNELLVAAKKPGNELFANRLYNKLQSRDVEVVDRIRAEGEETSQESTQRLLDINDYSSVPKRIQELSKDSLAGHLFKWSTDHRARVMQNFVADAITRPIAGNSGKGRIRTYDKGLEIDPKTKILESRDDVFFLDNLWKDKVIDATGLGLKRDKLVNHWSQYETLKKNNVHSDKIRAYEDLFEALAVRVPMDAMSGGRVLKFAGFTNIDGTGILMHGRKARALGGADLDGDTSFVFFGGMGADGRGTGFKKEWKDMYRWNESEFERTDKQGNIVEANAKEEYEALFTEPKNPRVSESQLLTFSPQTRQVASEKSYEGRKELGIVVTQIAYLKSAHASIASLPNKTFIVKNARKEVDKNGKETFFDLEITAKTDNADINRFNLMSKGAAGFASDPMDFNGLLLSKGGKLFKHQSDALFEYKLTNEDGKVPRKKDITIKEKKMGPYTTVQNINQGIYSRNWRADRKWELWEIQEKLDSIENGRGRIENENRNTFLTKIATDLENIDWSDNVISRLDPVRIKEVHDLYKKDSVKNKWLHEILDREHGVPVTNYEYIEWIINRDLHTYNGIKRETTSETWNPDLLDVKTPKGVDPLKFLLEKDQFRAYKTIVKRDDNGNIIYGKNGKPIRVKDPNYETNKVNRNWRIRVLNDIAKKGNDFIVQNYGDINSVDILKISGSKIPKERAQEIYKLANILKKSSYLHQKMKEEYADKLSPEVMREVTDKILSQFEIDTQINQIKSQLKNQKEIDFFEDAMLSTVWYSSIKTGLSKLGFASPEISDRAIQRWIGGYDKYFSATLKGSKDNLVEKAMEGIETLKTPQEIIDSGGTSTVGDYLETPLLDKQSRKYLNELAPFQFSGKKKRIDELPKDVRGIYYQLRDLFENYIPNWTAVDFNKYVRGLVGKDINMANKEDLQFVVNSLNKFRDGTWWQRVMRPVKDKFVKISPTHYYMFPKAIGQDTMRYDLERFEQIRQFQTKKHGTVIGEVFKPTNQIDRHQKTMHYTSEQATIKYRKIAEKFDEDYGPYLALKEGDALYKFAVREREMIMAKKKMSADKEFAPQLKHYLEDYNNIHKELDWNSTQSKVFNITTLNKKGESVIKKMTGSQIVRALDKLNTKWATLSYSMTAGNPKDLEGNPKETEGRLPVETGFDLMYRTLRTKDGKRDSKAMVDKFVKIFDKAQARGDNLDLDAIGIDGQRELYREQASVTAYLMGNQELTDVIKKIQIHRTSHLPFNEWYPHIMASNPKLAKERAKKDIQDINDNPKYSRQQKENMIIRTLIRMHKTTGDYMPTADLADLGANVDSAIRQLGKKKAKQGEAFQWLTNNRVIGSMHSRTSHQGGYDVSPDIMKMHLKQVIDAQYQHAAQIKMRHDLYKWKEWAIKKKGAGTDPEAKKWMDDWTDFWNLYIQQGMGNPSHIPERVLNNPDMKLKGTLYAWWSDMNVKKKIDKIYDKLGVKKDDRMLPEDLRGVDYQDIAKWSNLEAKFELASLLAHPKSMIANLYGGTANTLINTGFSNYRNARNLSYLQSNVNPAFKRRSDWTKWVNDLGVVEEFMIGEFGKNPKFASTKWKNFFKDAVGKINKDPSLSDSSLMAIVRKHGINTSLFNKAAWFMRRAERTLRRDSFIAHYLQARNNLEGAFQRWDDPALLAYAKKGVQATQFLYSAPFRPMFAATSLGKVMTRFQLWAWNSVRFRKDILEQANLRGYKEGTVEFERFKRLVIADAFMLALSSVFAYSLFEAALPAPLNWFQDTADWLFGDERERDRAFFGSWPSQVAPLQMITPPILRLAPAVFKGIVEEDWDKLANYYIWTMFPFGRMARDVVGGGGIIENPARTIEKVTGIPYMQFSQFYKEKPSLEKLGPGGIIRLKKRTGENTEG